MTHLDPIEGREVPRTKETYSPPTAVRINPSSRTQGPNRTVPWLVNEGSAYHYGTGGEGLSASSQVVNGPS